MRKRVNISSGTKWEYIIGYSRAVNICDLIEISGTSDLDGNSVLGMYDPYKQTKIIIEKFSSILKDTGSSLNDIIRVRIYVKNINHWEKNRDSSLRIFPGNKTCRHYG